VYLTRLPGGEGKWQLSPEGGGWTRFAPKGDRVIYRALNGDLMAVPVGWGSQGTVKVGRAERLFTWGSGWAPYYDLAPDGQRGVTALPTTQTSAASSLSLVQNWHREFLSGGR
jgi:hypothetical protein